MTDIQDQYNMFIERVKANFTNYIYESQENNELIVINYPERIKQLE